jgi:hypothetical protein
LVIVAVTAPSPISILKWVMVTPFFHFDDLAREFAACARFMGTASSIDLSKIYGLRIGLARLSAL